MPAASRRSLVILTLFALPALAVLIGLGVWQVQRLQWKEALIARIEERTAARPVPLVEGLRLAALGIDVEFLPVQGEAAPLQANELKLYWVQGGQPGWRLFAPYELLDGTRIVVDRGFVTDDALKQVSPASGQGLVRGRLRRGEEQGQFTPDNDIARNEWYWRDLPGMAKALGLGPDRLAPAFLVLEDSAAANSWPQATALPPEMSNRHLGYAITWFGLAACLAGVYGAYVFKATRSAP